MNFYFQTCTSYHKLTVPENKLFNQDQQENKSESLYVFNLLTTLRQNISLLFNLLRQMTTIGNIPFP